MWVGDRDKQLSLRIVKYLYEVYLIVCGHMQEVYLFFDVLVKLLSYCPGHPGKLSDLLLGFEQTVVSTLQVLKQSAAHCIVLGDLLNVDESFFIHNQLGAAHPGGINTRVPPLYRARCFQFNLTALVT